MFRKDGNKFNIKDTKNARDVALFVFLEISENSRKSNTILKETFEQAEKEQWGLSRTDRAFIERIVIGTLDRMISLDVILSRFFTKSLKHQKPIIRGILRISAYQLLYMDKVPNSAACNEGVKLAKLHGLDGLSGFVNGVLRAMVREIEAGGPKISQFDEAYQKYSVPKWIYELIVSEYGNETAERILESYLCDRKDTIRFNLSRPDAGDPEAKILESIREDGFLVRKLDMAELIKSCGITPPEGKLPVVYEIAEGGDITVTRAFKNGWITIQDPSSALVAAYAQPEAGDYIIDVCAAPGGKTLALADLIGNEGKISARDVSKQKVRLIDENVRRCGFTCIQTRVLDALNDDEDSLYRGDIVIADLPCSGLGVIAKKPDIKLNLMPYSVDELQGLQRDILRNISRFVKPRGKLIYSTCTISAKENRENAAWIAEELGFSLLHQAQILPGTDRDGFFIAVLQKKYS